MKKLSILFIANSFADDTIEYMPFIAKDLGYDLDLYNLYIGGCEVQKHIDNILNNLPAYELRIFNKEKGVWETKYEVSINEFVITQHWDYLVLQQASHLSGIKDALKNVKELIKLLKDLIKDDKTQFAWNMTWSYPKYSDLWVFKECFNCDQIKMFEGIIANVKEDIVTNKDFVKIIPNGTSIMNARHFVDDKLLHRDGLHLSYDYGRYLAGLTAIATFLDNDLSDVKYCPNIPLEVKKTFIECANLAIKEPFKYL